MKKILIAAAGGMVLSLAAFANTLTPGMESKPPDVLSLTGLTLVTSTAGSLNSLTFNATYDAAVYRGPNTFCATCLTFAYQVTDDSAVGGGTGIIEDLTAADFGTWMTDVGYTLLAVAQNGLQTGGTAPQTVGRSSAGAGAVVSFDYPDTGVPANNILPGDHTAVLLVETNATNYTAGLFSAIDGATATAAAYAPTTATPEPATLTFFGLGFLALSVLLRRVRRQA